MVSQSLKKRKTQERALGFLLFSFLFSNAPAVYATNDSKNGSTVNSPENKKQDNTEASSWLNRVEDSINTEPAKLAAPPAVAKAIASASDRSREIGSSANSSMAPGTTAIRSSANRYTAPETSAMRSSSNRYTAPGSSVIGSSANRYTAPGSSAIGSSASNAIAIGSTAIGSTKIKSTPAVSTASSPSDESTVIASAGNGTTANTSAENAKETTSASSENPDSDLPVNLAQDVLTDGVPLAQSAPIVPQSQAAPTNGVLLAQATPANSVPLAQASPVVNGRIEPSTTDPTAASNRIEELTKQTMLKIIELERFNLNYKANAAKQGRWKGWRYAAFNEINNSLGLTGGIISIHNRGSHLHSSSKVKTYIQEDANIIPMIGSIIGASAAAMEFGINEYHEYQAFRDGYSPGRARAKVAALRADIDRLLSERDALVAVEKSGDIETGAHIDTLEGRVLRDLRDQSLLEFQRYHLGARRLMAFQQSQYFFDFAKNVTNAIGFDFAYLSLHRHRRVWNGRAGTLFDVSGALTMGGPIISRAIGKVVGEYHKHYIKESIGEAEAKECAILTKDQQELEAYCQANRGMDVVGKIVDRSATYGDQSKIFQDEIQSASKQLDKAKLVATQNIGAGMFTGGAKLASGILFNAAGYPQLYNNSKTQTASRVTNHLLFAASVVGVPATSFAMADTLRIQVTGELNRKKLAAKGELPGQLIKKRLAQLDQLEARLKAQ